MAATALALSGAVIFAPAANAVPQATLAGSNFQIDDVIIVNGQPTAGANLKVDAPTATDPETLDWASPSINEIRAVDAPTGRDDNSYSGGVKEDTACPGETTGSIPNNKSDLLTFHAFEEAGSATYPAGFLNLAWSRVSDPSGTTLMDFEFNQSSEDCSTGPNKVRTTGDLLIEYAIDQGGARADISARRWTGTQWGGVIDVDAPSALCPTAAAEPGPCAVGTINQSPIPAADSDGLGAKQARTFGEAQIDLRLIFDDESCESFGSAMLKSRSSDAFTSQLKDFIAPVDIDLQNCGSVIIRKETNPEENPNATEFGYTKSFATDPTSDDTFTLMDDGVQDYTGQVLFGSNYTVTEDVVPSGWDLQSLNCNVAGHPSANVTPSINLVTGTVTFAIDSADDVLDCTYTNRARGTIIVEKVTSDGTGSFDFTTTSLGSPFTLTTSAAGAAGKDSETFSNLAPGTYDVAETVPAGWNLVSSTCTDSSDPGSIGLSAGETVTCTFTNARERGAIEITKTRKHAASGSGDYPHAGVTFTVTGGGLPAAGRSVVTNAAGIACIDDLVVSSFVGDYTVTETVPAGYVADGATAKAVTVSQEGTCTDTDTDNEATVSFSNTPLTDITVSVNSQVDGGTASTITCNPALPNPDAVTGPNGDGSHSVLNLLPGTYTCTIFVDP